MKNEEATYGDDWLLAKMESRMRKEDKSKETIQKYLRDVRKYLLYAKSKEHSIFCGEGASEYRRYLISNYKSTSANSMISSVNYFFDTFERHELSLKKFSTQRRPFRTEERELSMEEYRALIAVAQRTCNKRLELIMQTLASTGIRIGELRFITAEAVSAGQAEVVLKRKIRVILLPRTLRDRLRAYAAAEGITKGPLFVSRCGNPMDRSNVLHEMKRIAKEAGVDTRKVFPHNFRHLFAVTYYRAEKDICHLADILGHSNLNTTRIYTATGENEYSESLEQLGFL